MKIVIDLDDLSQETGDTGLAPHFVYRTLYMEYWANLQRTYHSNLWGLASACDRNARELYALNTGRRSNVKNLILTYSDAEACFQIFKQFADVWASNYKGR